MAITHILLLRSLGWSVSDHNAQQGYKIKPKIIITIILVDNCDLDFFEHLNFHEEEKNKTKNR